MKTEYRIEDDFLVFSTGQRIHIPTLELLYGANNNCNDFVRGSQSGKGNINIMIFGGKNKFGDISNTHN